MKILFNKYFDFIGVQNKGYKIVTFILLIICPIIYVLNEIEFEGHQILDLIFFNNSRLHRFTGKGLLELYSILLLPTIIVGVLVNVTKWVKMEDHRNIYFDFIGIENEGYRRLTLVIIIILGLIIPLTLGLDIEDILDSMFFLSGLEEFLGIYLLILFPSPIIVGVIVKVTNWVKEGFNK